MDMVICKNKVAFGTLDMHLKLQGQGKQSFSIHFPLATLFIRFSVIYTKWILLHYLDNCV
jgi:hypothetical protein